MISMLMCFLKEIHTMESLDFVAAYFYWFWILNHLKIHIHIYVMFQCTEIMTLLNCEVLTIVLNSFSWCADDLFYYFLKIFMNWKKNWILFFFQIRALLIACAHCNHYVCLSICLSAKTLTLVITFDLLVLGLSYFTCVFLLARPFIWYHDLDPLIFDLEICNLWRGPFWLSLLVNFLYN
jgi:hypothetical protein